ncbi:MAG: sulfatase [Bacteroidia bacterium]|nr:sulfatase [Bacteroidia bacterium]
MKNTIIDVLSNRVLMGFCFELAIVPSFAQHIENHQKQKPNFIYILTDDQGYNDMGCFGSPLIKTPHLDKMAKEGMKFTNYYAQTVSGPSRASLMTGCYPLRVAKLNNRVEIHPRLHLKENSIAEVLKDAGYTSACFGKWHLAGHGQVEYTPELLPCHQGFDYFFGTPSSNDLYVNLIRNDSVIEKNVDMASLTKRYTDEAIGFIEKNREKPFFVYLAHSMPHRIIAASEEFKGKSERGLYGDVIQELDYNTGRLLDKLKELGLDENTYVIYASDNGPWAILKENGGSAYPLRGAKTSTWEGGLRVPCIMWAPGKIPAGTVCNEVATTMDILPTFAKLAKAKVPSNRIIDGHDITNLMLGKEGAKSPTKAFFYYQHTHLQAVRSGEWKLMLVRPAQPSWCPPWSTHIRKEDAIDIREPMLFNLVEDNREQIDVAKEHPKIVEKLLKLAEKGKNDIGDYDRVGKGARFFDDAPKRPDIGNSFHEY